MPYSTETDRYFSKYRRHIHDHGHRRTTSVQDIMRWGVDTTLESDDAARREHLARPLLKLVALITGVETSFITVIDWVGQKQFVVFALNSSELQVPEGASVDWEDSTCRWTFLSGRPQTSDVPGDFPGSLGGELGMRSFFAIPILNGETVLGTVCGASRAVVELGNDKMEMVQLIADALAEQFKADGFSRAHRDRAEREVFAAQEQVSAMTVVAHEMETLALTDHLTGLDNRRGFIARWEQELANSGRHGHDIALLVADIDAFKDVNDKYGHAGGDRALQAMGEVMRSACRSGDVAARLGGDEFALALSHTGVEGAIRVAERIRSGFAEVVRSLSLPCTVSIGISGSDHTQRRDLMAAADRALYRGKHLGRNRVEIWAEETVAQMMGQT
jgi:diguanylate cyclase